MEKVTGLTTALAAITAVTFAVWVLKRRRRLRLFRELGIPGPNPDFIWGNLMQMHHRRLEVKSQEGNKEPILESLRQVIKDMEHSAIDVAFTVPVVRAFLNLIYPLTRHGREFRNVIRHVREAVELRRSGRLPKEPCILETVLDQQSQTLNAAQSKRSGRGIYLEDHYVTSNVAIFLLAGIETTASLLSFLMHQLAKHPEEQRKIVEEMEDVLPTKEGSEFSFDQLHLLKRVDMVIYEGLRLYPSVPLYVVRRCAQDTTVCGQFIPAGVNVMIAPWLIHRDHDYWPEPDEFIPDRFAEESSEGHRRKVYIPFGLGPKVCIGQKLALLVVKSALVQILQKHRLTLGTEASGGPILSLPGMALVPGDGVKVSLERRQAKAAA
ncbi:hypothetical protein HPB50_010049 [Hyalomma asiaticum]|uniref:Uncharacterized protein n=1 Tax=Hyalomma asiaticum TaxID=266040 RepID=A0ACB7S2U2_HYAAI|nr:hypothetical protein HPB50_010049 [Hyalomma asiaticum]